MRCNQMKASSVYAVAVTKLRSSAVAESMDPSSYR